MRQYLVLGIILFEFIACASNTPPKDITSKNSTQKVDNNTTKKKKILVIDLYKEINKEDYSKGGLLIDENQTIPININEYRGDNDEVLFKVDKIKKADKIKIGDNDEVAFTNNQYRIKTLELKDGEIITIKYGDEQEIRMRIRVLN